MKGLKEYFIPHEENGHKPKFFSWENTVLVISAALFLEVLFLVNVFWFLPKTNYTAFILPGVVVNLTNENRAEYGAPTLKVNETLARAAQMKAEDMAAKGYFSHTGPNGTEPWDWMERAGYDFSHAGENLAINFVDSEDVVSAWMRSQSHKENIVDARFKEIGIGVAKGVYEGREAVFVVQFFGTPRAVSPAAAQAGAPAAGNVPKLPSIPKTQTLAAPLSTPNVQNLEGALRTALAEPHMLLTGMYTVIITMIALALCLMIFIKIRVQHPRLIMNGAAMLLMIGSLIVLNHYLMLSQVKIF
jgi:hypothetical protein